MMTPEQIDAEFRRLEPVCRGDPESDDYWSALRKLAVESPTGGFPVAVNWTGSSASNERALGLDFLNCVAHKLTEEETRAARLACGAALSCEDDGVIIAALAALGHLNGYEEVLNCATKHWTSANADIRYYSVFAMTGSADESPAVAEILLSLMTDSDGDVRDWATFAIGTQSEIDTPEVRDALRARLSDQHDETRAEAMAGLAKRGDRSVLPSLIEAFTPDADGELSYWDRQLEAAAYLADPALYPLLADIDGDGSELLNTARDACRTDVAPEIV